MISIRRLIRTRSLAVTTALTLTLGLLPFGPWAPRLARAASADVVIAQVYGGGGGNGATYKNDYIALFNRGTAAVSITGWSVQYASASGSSWARTNLTGTIQPGQSFLVAESGGPPAQRCRPPISPVRSPCQTHPARSPW